MNWCRRKYGKTFVVKLPSFHVVLMSDPEAIRTIFAAKPDEMHAGKFNRILRPLVGSSSVLLLDGSEHVHRRKLLLPSFHGERMRFYGRTMADITQHTIDSWPLNQPFSLHAHTQEITLQIILRTVFGVDEGERLNRLRDSIKAIFKRTEQPLAFIPLIFLAERPDAETRAPWNLLLKHRNRTDQLLYQEIAARRADPNREGRKDVLSMLLAARDEDGEAMTDKELRDELMTALAAGHETTATSLAWAVERLLATPETYRRLRDEVRALGKNPEPEQLAALPYLDATIKEVMRLRPVVPIVGRVLQKAYRLGGYDLPAGTPVGASIFLAQRDPDVYPDPEAFKPERFLGVTPDPASWLPFGGGLRRCVGAAFATYEMKVVLGTIMARCDLTLAQAVPAKIIRRAVTFWPEGGTRICVTARS